MSLTDVNAAAANNQGKVNIDNIYKCLRGSVRAILATFTLI